MAQGWLKRLTFMKNLGGLRPGFGPRSPPSFSSDTARRDPGLLIKHTAKGHHPACSWKHGATRGPASGWGKTKWTRGVGGDDSAGVAREVGHVPV